MCPSEKVRVRLESLDERLARLRAEKDRLVARASRTERKRDTRRKIVIGGTVLAAIEHEGVPAMRTHAELRAVARRPAHASARPRRVRSGAAEVGLTVVAVPRFGAPRGASGSRRGPPPVAGAGRAGAYSVDKATGALWRFFETPGVRLWPREVSHGCPGSETDVSVAAAPAAAVAVSITCRFGPARARAVRARAPRTTTSRARASTTTRIATRRSTRSPITCRRGRRTTRPSIGTRRTCFERANGRLYVSADFALPRDLVAEDQVELAREFAQELTDEEHLPYTLAIHAGRDENGENTIRTRT